jgi:glucose/arabinose dehydrogenase
VRARTLRELAVAGIILWGTASAGRAATGLPPGFQDATFVSGLSNPTAMQFAPDGRLFVAQQGGQLRVVKNGALLSTPFLTFTVNYLARGTGSVGRIMPSGTVLTAPKNLRIVQ